MDLRVPSLETIKAEHSQPDNGSSLIIGVINNTGDQGLQPTETRFSKLVRAASLGRTVQLKFVSLPGVIRSTATQAYIGSYYDDLSALMETPPDGLIVTGAEPRADRLIDEAFWPAFTRLIDWVETSSIPAIWSCLAAQGAVLCMDGISRQRLRRKLSGIYACQVNPTDTSMGPSLPQNWSMPHSRFYDIPEGELRAHGYQVISRSDEVGVDMFLKPGRALQVFFQGHPEYESSTLLGEYRRDVNRFLTGQQEWYPDFPLHYGTEASASHFLEFQQRATNASVIGLLDEFKQIPSPAEPANEWWITACDLYRNWLDYLSARRSPRPPQVQRQMEIIA